MSVKRDSKSKLSKAARGRPEGPTERSVFKIIFVMLAVFQLRFLQIYKVEVCHVTGEKDCEPMAEGLEIRLANGRVGEISATNSRGREERVFRDNSEREGCNCERRKG